MLKFVTVLVSVFLGSVFFVTESDLDFLFLDGYVDEA